MKIKNGFTLHQIGDEHIIMHNGTGLFFWGFLVVYGIVMFAISPKAVTIGGFFKGTDKKGRAASSLMVTSSVFIAWIFAKSV